MVTVASVKKFERCCFLVKIVHNIWKMLDSFLLKRVELSMLRAHLCTLSMAMSLNAWWRLPRDAFRYGGLAFGLAHSVAMVVVAMPVTLLQLAAGQLSQQDVVGIWRAVPFFRGVGYLRLLITCLSSVYTIIYLALITTNFLNTLSSKDSFLECTELLISEDIVNAAEFNTSLLCYNGTLMAPISEQPEYYVAISLIIMVFWIAFPFMLYSPVTLMKRIFYVLGPLVLILGTVIICSIGQWTDLVSIQKGSDWPNFLDPDIWHAALIQALWSSQVAGGFLVSSGDTIYSSTNVQWTTIIIIVANIASSWLGLMFWFAIGGNGVKDTSPVAVLYVVYSMTDEQLHKIWPLLVLLTLLLSGVITMLILLYPLYDRFRRIGGHRWRLLCAVSSCVGAVAAAGVLAGGLPGLLLLEDIAMPLLVSLTTVLEVAAFLFIYGWKILVEDVEFLTGEKFSKLWVMGWCVAPGVLAPFSAWWLAVEVMQEPAWWEQPWPVGTLLATAGVAALLLLVSAAVAVTKQVQYDCIGKLKASFIPSRHWGPRDPITHYYWLARREEADRGQPVRSRYLCRQLGQLSTRPSIIQLRPPTAALDDDLKHRSNSDDWLYTIYRKRYLEEICPRHLKNGKIRSKSLDWDLISYPKYRNMRRKSFRKFIVKKKTLENFMENNDSKKNTKIVDF